MAIINIPDDWKPTAANINALPEPIRIYLHHLETHWDPALTLQQNVALRDRIAELEALVELAKVFSGGKP